MDDLTPAELRTVKKAIRAAYAKGRAAERRAFDALLARFRALKELNGSGGVFAKAFEESKHPRADDGRFGSGGAHADAPQVSPPATPDEHPADAKARGLLSRLKDVPRATREKVGKFVQGKYDKLKAKYGTAGAKAVLGATVLLAPIPLPGTAFLPVALAEAVLRIRRAIAGTVGKALDDDHGLDLELDDATIRAEAETLLAELYAELGEELPADDALPGGRADGAGDADFDAAALARGAAVEAEHTSDPALAREIARDHLAEDPDYYAKLAAAEGGGADPHAALADALLAVAEDAADTGDDPQPALERLRALVGDPAALAEVLAQSGADDATVGKCWRVLKAGKWDESKHPRGKGGHFISKDRIEAAKSDPKLAKQLREEVKPEDAGKLDDAIAGKTDLGRTKRGQARHDAAQHAAAKEQTRKRVHEIVTAVRDGEATPEHLHELCDHLQSGHLTKESLTNARILLGAKFGAGKSPRHEQMVAALVKHARGRILEARMQEHAVTGADAEDMRQAVGLGAEPHQKVKADYNPDLSGTRVTAPDGSPLVVYHGRKSPVVGFDDAALGSTTGHPTTVWGHFFTPQRSEAERYSTFGLPRGQTGHVLAANLNLKNPYPMSKQEFAKYSLTGMEAEAAKLKEKLRRDGYDGIHIQRGTTTDYSGKPFNMDEYVAFGADQIHPDHRSAVEQALAAGKPVPPEVLADYPDLAAKEAAPVTGTPQPPAPTPPAAPGAAGGKSKVEYVRAAAGGQVSEVDGKFYRGGQLMPVHGRYSGAEKPPKGDGVGTADPVQAREDGEGGGGGVGRRPQLTPEEQRQRAENQRKWDEMSAGPLGKLTWLGTSPNSKAFDKPGTKLKEWREFAESVGPDGVNRIIAALEPEFHGAVASAFGKIRDENARKKEAGEWNPQYHRDVDADAEEWEKNQAKVRAGEAVGMMPGGKKHEKQVPGSHYARELVNELMRADNNPGRSLIDAYHRLHSVLSGSKNSPVSPPAAPGAAGAKPDNPPTG